VIKHGLLLWLLTLVLAQLISVSVRAAPGSTQADKYQLWRSQAVRALAAKADANSLASAAALEFTNPEAATSASSALQWITRASDLAPGNSAIGWLHLQLCTATPSCDSREVAIVLRWIDPYNAAAWMSQLATAHKDKDTIEVDRVLADMARSTRFDLYYNQIIVLMFDALNGVRRELPGNVVASDTAKLTALAGVVNAEIIPPFSPLIDSCRESASASERREDCLKVARIMQRGDTVIAQIAGFGIERRLLPADSKEARILAERRHLLEWRLASAAKLDRAILPWTSSARTRTRLAEMRLRPREEDVCIALLRDSKMAVEPTEMRR
jgi:hypothetical protein